MAKPKQRNARIDTSYAVTNQLAGREGDVSLDRKDRRAWRRIVNRLCDFYLVRVTFLRLYSRGYALQVAAPAGRQRGRP